MLSSTPPILYAYGAMLLRDNFGALRVVFLEDDSSVDRVGL